MISKDDIARVVTLSTSLPATDYCTGVAIPITDREVVLTDRAGEVYISKDGMAAGLQFRGRISWFFCPIGLMGSSGKEVLDQIIPVGSGYVGAIQNAELRGAVMAIRPDLVQDGNSLMAPLAA